MISYLLEKMAPHQNVRQSDCPSIENSLGPLEQCVGSSCSSKAVTTNQMAQMAWRTSVPACKWTQCKEIIASLLYCSYSIWQSRYSTSSDDINAVSQNHAGT